MKLLNNFFNITKAYKTEKGKDAVGIELNPDHDIFKAHFPNNPVTPGVCIIGIISETLEYITGKQLLLSHIKNLKFVGILSPITAKNVTVVFHSIDTDDECLKVKGELTNEDSILTKFSFIFKTKE